MSFRKVVEFLSAPSTIGDKIGSDGPVPMTAHLTNKQVFIEYLARNGFKLSPIETASDTKPNGLTNTDALHFMAMSERLRGMIEGCEVEPTEVLGLILQNDIASAVAKVQSAASAPAETAPASVEPAPAAPTDTASSDTSATTATTSDTAVVADTASATDTVTTSDTSTTSATVDELSDVETASAA